jgi:hypothetical protein
MVPTSTPDPVPVCEGHTLFALDVGVALLVHVRGGLADHAGARLVATRETLVMSAGVVAQGARGAGCAGVAATLLDPSR